MPVGRQNSGPLWVEGSIAFRVRDKKHRAWRMVKIRRPYAVVGSHPKADLVIDRADVAQHHIFLLLDQRGLFGVDLRTDRGTRFAGTEAEASWLGSGDLIEIGESTIEIIQLRVNGAVVSGPLSNDDPLSTVDHSPCVLPDHLTLRLIDHPNLNWSVGSSLVFLGRGPACAVRLTDHQIGLTHSALFRDGSGVYLISLPGETTTINERAVLPAMRLVDSDVLRIGHDSVQILSHIAVPKNNNSKHREVFEDHPVAAGEPEAFNYIGFDLATSQRINESDLIDYPALIGRLQAETAALVAILLRRIERLDDEMASLRNRLDAESHEKNKTDGPPVEQLRWDLIPQPDSSLENTSRPDHWLVDRLRELETERRTTWTDFISRIGSPKSTG